KVSSVVTFGDPRNPAPIAGADGKTLILCQPNDAVCSGGFITVAHLRDQLHHQGRRRRQAWHLRPALPTHLATELHHRHHPRQDQQHRCHRRAPRLHQPLPAQYPRCARRRRRWQWLHDHPRGLPRLPRRQ
ncbi:hypothetical protein BN1708_018351, partial [Verticillium longisporum]